jgi:hypothetical protein
MIRRKDKQRNVSVDIVKNVVEKKFVVDVNEEIF